MGLSRDGRRVYRHFHDPSAQELLVQERQVADMRIVPIM